MDNRAESGREAWSFSRISIGSNGAYSLFTPFTVSNVREWLLVVDEEKAFGQDVSTSVEEGHLVHSFS